MSELDPALTYSSYLAIDELLNLQRPLSDGPEPVSYTHLTLPTIYSV